MEGTIWIALAIVLVIEGVGPMLFPKKWQHYIRSLSDQPIEHLRTLGGVMVTVGAVTLYFLLNF